MSMYRKAITAGVTLVVQLLVITEVIPAEDAEGLVTAATGLIGAVLVYAIPNAA